MFASKITKEVKLEDGTVVVRKLSAKSLGKAREQRQISASDLTRRMGPDMIKAFREAAADRGSRPEVDPVTARYEAYDRETVLKNGIVSWSYDVSVEDGLEDVDEPSAEKLFREIIDLSDPAGEELEKAEKNG